MMPLAEARLAAGLRRRPNVVGPIRLFKGALFMRLIGFAACVLASSLLVACQTPSAAPPPSPTVSPDQFSTIKAAYARSNPNWIVGTVGDVLPDQSLFTVVDIPANTVKQGDVFTVKDANNNSLADGVVKNVDSAGTMVAVQYEPVPGATRAPMPGDIVIHVPIAISGNP
jgi:hypothetical protein